MALGNCRMNGNWIPPKTIRELGFYVRGEFKTIHAKNNSIQNELTEHKNGHYKIMTIAIAITSIIISIANIIIFSILK